MITSVGEEDTTGLVGEGQALLQIGRAEEISYAATDLESAEEQLVTQGASIHESEDGRSCSHGIGCLEA